MDVGASCLAVDSRRNIFIAIGSYVYQLLDSGHTGQQLKPVVQVTSLTWGQPAVALVCVDEFDHLLCISQGGGVLLEVQPSTMILPVRLATITHSVSAISTLGSVVVFTEFHQGLSRVSLFKPEAMDVPESRTSFGIRGKHGHVDGPALAAVFSEPCALETDSSGAVFIADKGNNCIRVLKDQSVRTLADSASPSQRATVPLFVSQPRCLALDKVLGWLYVVEGTDPTSIKLIRGLPGSLYSYVSPMHIDISDYGEKICIVTRGAPLSMHKVMAMLRVRCLLSVDLSSVDLHHTAVTAFLQYIYADHLPIAPPCGVTPARFFGDFLVRFPGEIRRGGSSIVTNVLTVDFGCCIWLRRSGGSPDGDHLRCRTDESPGLPGDLPGCHSVWKV